MTSPQVHASSAALAASLEASTSACRFEKDCVKGRCTQRCDGTKLLAEINRTFGPLVCTALRVGLKKLLQDAAGMPSRTRQCRQKARPAALESAVAFAKDHDRLPGLHTAAYVCNAQTVKGKSESLFK